MSLAYIHLALAHLPVIGVPILMLLLASGLAFKKEQVKTAALVGLAAVAILTIPVYLTGESAEELVEDIAGVSESQIEDHESAATVAFIAVIITGIFSLLTLAAVRFPALKWSWSLNLAVASAVCTSCLLAWTANQGGKIRHTEISNNSTSNKPSEGERDEDHTGE